MYIEVDGKKVYFRSRGKGAPLIFIHGWGGTIESLNNLAKIASKKYKTIVFDLPGFGKSDNPEPTWGVAEYSDFVRAFIKKLGYSKYSIFGHSFGGSIAIYIAEHYPQVIDTLVLSGVSFRRDKKVHPLAKFFKNIVPAGLKVTFYKIFFPRSDLSKYPHLESNFRNIVTQDLSHNAKNIKAKTLILWGENDTYTPVANAYLLHDLIKGSVLEIYPDKGHGLPLKYPEIVYKKLENFV